MKNLQRRFIAALLAAIPAASYAASSLTVTAVNKLQLTRENQTLELSAKDLASLGETDLTKIHVADASGNALVCQAVDTDYDAYHTPDTVIFQANFAPGETKTFTVTAGAKWEYTKDQYKAFGRFVRERFDDYAWENDRIAHRMYGKGLEVWEGEPLTSSAIDIWSKHTSQMVINDWYMLDNYHRDLGTGYDDYSAGTTRGDGGIGLWSGDRLWVSRNFVDSRSLANGPIRVMFELVYEPFEVNGISVSEIMRVSLDAGQNLDHYKISFKPYTRPGHEVALTAAIGLKKVPSEKPELNTDHGWYLKWEEMEQKGGMQGLAVVFDPKIFVKQTEDKLNQLVLAKTTETNTVSYWAGFCWDKFGSLKDPDAWKKYVDEFAQGTQAPIEVSVSAK